jgi:hypothetical protein
MKHLCCLLLLALSCASVVAAPRVSVTTDTNGVLVAPIGFFQANSHYIQEMIDTAVALASTNAVWPTAGQGTSAETNGYTVTINADVTLQVATNIAKAAAEVATNGLGTAAQVTAASNVVHSALIASNALLQAQIAASTNSAATIGLINTASNQLSAALVATNSLLLSQIFATTNGMATKEAITNSILALTDSPTNFILNTAGYPTNSGAYVTNGGTANVTATNASALAGLPGSAYVTNGGVANVTSTNTTHLGGVAASSYSLGKPVARLAAREARALGRLEVNRNPDTVVLTGATNIHGSLIWRDPASGSNYFFGSTRPTAGGASGPAQLVRVPCDNLSAFTVLQFPATADYEASEQIVCVSNTIYMLFCKTTGNGTYTHIVSVDPLTLETNTVLYSTTHQTSGFGTMETDGRYLYVVNGRSYPGYIYKIGFDGTIVATNTIQPTIAGATELPGSHAHSLVYDGRHLFATGNNMPSSGYFGWVMKINPDDLTFVSAQFTNTVAGWRKSTDDMAEVGEWLFIGPESFASNASIAVVKKDLSEVRWVHTDITNSIYGVFYVAPYVYALAVSPHGDAVRIDPSTLAWDVVRFGGATNLNELAWDGANFFVTSWALDSASPAVLTRVSEVTSLGTWHFPGTIAAESVRGVQGQTPFQQPVDAAGFSLTNLTSVGFSNNTQHVFARAEVLSPWSITGLRINNFAGDSSLPLRAMGLYLDGGASAGSGGVYWDATTVFNYETTNIIQQGLDGASAPAQVLKGPDRTGFNAAGTNYTIRAGRGTGTGTPGSLIIDGFVKGSSGATAHANTTNIVEVSHYKGLVLYPVAAMPAITGGIALVNSNDMMIFAVGPTFTNALW